MRLPRCHESGRHRARQTTLDPMMQGRPQRLRHHLQRPALRRTKLTNKTAYTELLTDPREAAEYFNSWPGSLSRIERGLSRDDNLAGQCRDWLHERRKPRRPGARSGGSSLCASPGGRDRTGSATTWAFRSRRCRRSSTGKDAASGACGSEHRTGGAQTESGPL